MSAGRPGAGQQPGKELPRCEQEPRAVPPGRPIDPTILHRARSINADALRVVDELLDQIADEERR